MNLILTTLINGKFLKTELGAALSEVNWHEIAGHLIDDAWEAISKAVEEREKADA